MSDQVFVSLTNNCTGAQKLRQYGLRTNAYPFDWNFTPSRYLPDIFENDFVDFCGGNDNIIVNANSETSKYCVINPKYHIGFLHDYGFGDIDQTIIDEVKCKYDRRIARLKELLTTTDKQVVFLWYECANIKISQIRQYTILNPDDHQVHIDLKVLLVKSIQTLTTFLYAVRLQFEIMSKIMHVDIYNTTHLI